MLSFNNHIPGVIFKVQQTGSMVQIKPFASYYAWIDWFDLAPLDQTALIDELRVEVDAAAAAAAAAQTTANTGVTNAATAQGVAEAANFNAGGAAINAGFAQADADTAILNAAAAMAYAVASRPILVSIQSHQLIWTVGTPANAVAAAYPDNYAVFTTTDLASAYVDLLLAAGTWTFKFMVLTRNDAGKVNIVLGAVTLASAQELYTASANNAAIITYANKTIPDGVSRLTFTVAGHTSPSSSYVFLPIRFWGYRTGA